MILIVFFIAGAVTKHLAPEGHELRDKPSLPMMLGTVFGVVAKVLHAQIIVDIHEALLDAQNPMQWQLAELHDTMQTLWEMGLEVVALPGCQEK